MSTEIIVVGDDLTLETTETVFEVLTEGVQGPRGAQGQTGPSGDRAYFDAVSVDDLVKGQPVYMLRTGAQVGLADASSYIKSFVIGYAVDNVAAGFAGQVGSGQLVLSDWTVVAGTPSLSVGLTYFLKNGGGITSMPPSAPSSATSTVVGIAATADMLIVNPSKPILF